MLDIGLKLGGGINIYRKLQIGTPLISLFGISNNYNLYNFFTNLAFIDLVSGNPMTTILEDGRFGYAGGEFGEDVLVIEFGKLLTNGAYTQLIKKSEDISDGVWSKARISAEMNVIIAPDGQLTADKIIADASADASHLIFQLFTASDNTVYTYSIYLKKGDFNWGRVSAKKKTGADASAFFDLDNGAIGVVLGATAVIDSVGDGWYRCTISYDVLSGGTAADVRVYIAEADNDFILAGTVTGQGIYAWGGQVTESPYRLPYVPNDTTGIKTVPLNYSDADEGIKAIGMAANFPQLLDALYGTDGTDAQGRMTIPWTPRFDAADVSGVVHILTANDDATSFLFYNGATQEIHAYDGTNTAVVACTPVNGTEYQIILDYGDNSGQKMRLSVDTTVGTAVTYAGSFPIIADGLSIAWNEEVPQEIGEIIFAKEPSW